LCFSRKNSPLMRKNAYKDTLDFLIAISHRTAEGHHLKRLQSMAGLVHSCIKSKKCTLEDLSQPRQTCQTTVKGSLLQQTKRWLDNKWVDWEGFFLPLAKRFLDVAARKGELILVIDGSQTGPANTCLMVSVLCRGFAIPLAWVVKKGKKGHFPEQMHLDVLDMLLPAVPGGCRVVLLGDGEFDGQRLLEWCADQKWEFVLRTACDRQVDFGGEKGRIDALSMPQGHTSLFLHNALPGINAVFWHEKRFEKPIFLLTNMDVGKMACRYYKRRFQIETMFKQLKSKGFQLHKTRLECPTKTSNLIMVVATAFIFSFCMGCFLKHQCDEKTLSTIARKDKIKNMGFIKLAQSAWDDAFNIALLFFSDLSKNFDWVFS
jgi:Transposase DDE domain